MKKIKGNIQGGHTWRFFRAGGFDQVRLDTAQDLLAVEHLDQKLWVALAAPIDNVNFDSQTLSFIDNDNDRRIRASELIAAIKWACSLLRDPEDLIRGEDSITLRSINDDSDEGKLLTASLKSALKALGKDETGAVTVDDTGKLENVLSERMFNGDGIINEDVISDEEVKGALRDIIAAVGAITDRTGKAGINKENLDNFFDQAVIYDKWMKEAETNAAIRILGEDTDAAGKAIAVVKDKIDDYFTRCAVGRFDERSISILNGDEQDLSSISRGLLSSQSERLAVFPLAKIDKNSSLPLTSGINPAWSVAMEEFRQKAVEPILGSIVSMTESNWKDLLMKFDLWHGWNASKPAITVDVLGIDRIRVLLGSSAKAELVAMIEKDNAEAPAYKSLVSLEKIARYKRDLYRLCTNFINFKDFYAKEIPAIFQAGVLYLDQRSCHLCIRIDDVGKHSIMAAMAGTYLVYCECKRTCGTEKMVIVAALTNGDSENIIVGRNGIFYDRSGRDWDANIIKVIENPISIRQAFWLPYKSLVRMIESQVAKRATTAEAQSSAKLTQVAATTANIDKTKTEPALPPKKLDVGIVAALGVAAGALGTFVATFFGHIVGIIKLGPLATVGAAAGVIALISGPSIVLAYIKLRKRNLGPILDSGGWAVNAKARINIPFGTVLTQVASLPPGAKCDLFDPYAEKKSPWPKLIAVAVLLYIAYVVFDYFGFVNEWSGGKLGKLKSTTETIANEEKNQNPAVIAP